MDTPKKVLRVSGPDITGYITFDTKYKCLKGTPGFNYYVGEHYLRVTEGLELQGYTTRWVGNENVAVTEW